MTALFIIIWLFAGIQLNANYDTTNKVDDHGAGEWVYHAIYFTRVLFWPVMNLDKWPEYGIQFVNHIKGIVGK